MLFSFFSKIKIYIFYLNILILKKYFWGLGIGDWGLKNGGM
jgi:hypothetical protein